MPTTIQTGIFTDATRARRISWGAVFAGMIVAIAIQIALMMLGAGIGLANIDPGEQPSAGMAIGTGVWMGISTLIALFLGGMLAGHLSASLNRVDGALHGVTAWALAVVLTTSALGGLAGAGASLYGRHMQQNDPNAMSRLQDRLGIESAEVPGAEATAPAVPSDVTRVRQASGVAFWGFVAMLLGCGAAAWGGFLGIPKRLLTELSETRQQHREAA